MRAYFFANFYLSDIQRGIQALHVTSRMFSKYGTTSVQNEMLYNWSDNHETVIIKNGGNSENLRSIIKLLESPANPYPWDCFFEDKESLDGALTCTGLIVPTHIYEAADFVRGGGMITPSPANGKVFYNGSSISMWDLELINIMNRHGLA